ncbi:MAG: protein-disulfide reductase DsbD family protein [Alphaproteobacteria bacterium]
MPGILALAQTAHSEPGTSDWIDYGQGQIRLVSATTGVVGEDLLLGLQYKIAPGWEIYWRSPGEAGLPTTIDWQGSTNLDTTTIQWPLPGRFKIFGIDTFGYKNEVVLPIPARVVEPGGPTDIRAAVNFQTCKEQCVLHDVVLNLTLPPGGEPSNLTSLINRYKARVPTQEVGFGLAVERVEIVEVSGGQLVQVVATSAVPFAEPDVLVEGPRDYRFLPPKVRITDNGTRAVLQVPIELSLLGSEETKPPLVGTDLVLTLVDGGRAVEQGLVATAGQPENVSFLPLFVVLGLALLGGLILNIMPCVLPVLSIKLLGVVKHGGGESRPVRRSFLASAAGILFAFVVLATFLVGLQSAGIAVGWGIQFQQPLFIVAMTLLITLFASNMWGFFDVVLPPRLLALANRLPGGGTARSEGLAGSFGTGVFATIMATPCSAPFLGTAIGFALTRGTVETYLIFAALGAGMAVPYLLVAAVPVLATKLPKPGAWMVTVRRILGLALAGTAAWLLSILGGQLGAPTAVMVGGLMLATVAALWARRRYPVHVVRRLTPAAVLALGITAMLGPQWVDARIEMAESAPVATWQAFEPELIPGLVASGKVVFVDVTADWCVTCLVNKKLVLDRGQAARLLNHPDMIAMQGDWTNPDERITNFLATFNRFGIPFNAVYGPDAPNGLVLPELLNEARVLKTVRRAAGRDLLAENIATR